MNRHISDDGDKKNMANEKVSLKPIKTQATKQIELPSYDPTPFRGKSAVIESCETVETQFGIALQVATDAVDTFNDKEIRATKLFSLVQNKKTGELGWTRDSKLGQFLAAYGVEHYDQLIGKKVTLTIRADAKTGKKWLDFV